MKKFKVCTYHIKFDNSDQIYENIYNLSSKINKKYCELNDYDYTCNLFDESILKNFLDNDFFKFDKKWDKACIFKYQYLLDILNSSQNDYIVYVEYDACFCNTIKKLEDYIDNEHSIFYSRCNWSWDINHYFYILKNIEKYLYENKNEILNYNKCSSVLMNYDLKQDINQLGHFFFCNEGFYIFKNDEISKNFLKCMIKYATLFSESYSNICSESQCVGKLMSKSYFYHHLTVLPPKTQGHIYGGTNKYDEDECLVCHNSTIDKNILYEKLVNISENKYWKGVL